MPEEVDRPYIRIRGTRLGTRHKIANVLTPMHEGATDRDASETRANAYLISAAPDLLEAASEWVAAQDAYRSAIYIEDTHAADLAVEEAEKKARAALAKARGAA